MAYATRHLSSFYTTPNSTAASANIKSWCNHRYQTDTCHSAPVRNPNAPNTSLLGAQPSPALLAAPADSAPAAAAAAAAAAYDLC
jgi:hypothetical protein